MENKEIDRLAKIIWDYCQMHHKLEKADCILVLGSNDLRVAERGAQLYLDGFAPYIVFSGTGFGHKHRKDMLATNWQKAEADVKNGILTVTIPKADAAKPKKIDIKTK